MRAVLLCLLVVLSVDSGHLLADARVRDVSSTWVQAVDDRAPDDLVVSFAPTLTGHYLGRTDFWLRSDDYAKYVWAGRAPFRDVHTGAILIRDTQELGQLLLTPHQGRTAWIILDGEPAAETNRAAREVALALAALAIETHRSPDGPGRPESAPVAVWGRTSQEAGRRPQMNRWVRPARKRPATCSACRAATQRSRSSWEIAPLAATAFAQTSACSAKNRRDRARSG